MINTQLQPGRTEESRIDLFIGTDQHKWEEKSKEVESQLSEMFSNAATLLEMCNYASKRRGEIAVMLSHRFSHKFGKIRQQIRSDDYSLEKFAGGRPNLPALLAMKNIISKYDRLGSYPVRLSDKVYDFYQCIKSKSNEKEVSVGIFFENENENRFWIRCTWPLMSQKKYDLVLTEFDSIRKAIFNESSQTEEVLRLLGLLAYDLSNINLYDRGSASITGWIIRAIANIKGFNLDGALKVNGLPFDIYAQVQTREQYVIDFLHAIKKQFNLQIALTEKFIERIQEDKIINEDLYLNFIEGCLLHSIESDNDKFIKIQKFCHQQSFKNFDGLIALAIKLNTDLYDYHFEYSNFLLHFLETSCAIDEKQKQRIEKYRRTCTAIREIKQMKSELTDSNKRKPYFKIDCEFTNEGKEEISIMGGHYISQEGYGRYHDILKNKYVLENLLFEKFGLPYFSLAKFLNPDNSSIVTIPIELLWEHNSFGLHEKRLPLIATLFDNQSQLSSSSNDNSSLPTLGKRKLKN